MSASIGRASLAVLAAAAALVACHSNASYVPSSSGGSAASRAGATKGTAVQKPGIPACTLPAAKLPGTYLSFTWLGTLAKGSLEDGLVATWTRGTYVAAKATPTPEPTTLPAIYAYYGTFALKKTKLTGCFVLETSVSGEAVFTGPYGNFNAQTTGNPNITAKGYSLKKTLDQGSFTIQVKRLSSKGGTGTLNLVNFLGQPFDTGTVKIQGRVKLP